MGGYLTERKSKLSYILQKRGEITDIKIAEKAKQCQIMESSETCLSFQRKAKVI